MDINDGGIYGIPVPIRDIFLSETSIEPPPNYLYTEECNIYGNHSKSIMDWIESSTVPICAVCEWCIKRTRNKMGGARDQIDKMNKLIWNIENNCIIADGFTRIMNWILCSRIHGPDCSIYYPPHVLRNGGKLKREHVCVALGSGWINSCESSDYMFNILINATRMIMGIVKKRYINPTDMASLVIPVIHIVTKLHNDMSMTLLWSISKMSTNNVHLQDVLDTVLLATSLESEVSILSELNYLKISNPNRVIPFLSDVNETNTRDTMEFC